MSILVSQSTLLDKPETAQEMYINVRDTWQPDPSDNPDCHWFYAAFDAVRTVCSVYNINLAPVHYLVHEAICWTRGESWISFTAQLKSLGEKLEYPREPTTYGFYEMEPAKPEDVDAINSLARSLFTTQFKQAFPGKRANSREANQYWDKLSGKAKELAIEQLTTQHKAWSNRRSAHLSREGKLLADWQEKKGEVDSRRNLCLLITSIQ